MHAAGELTKLVGQSCEEYEELANSLLAGMEDADHISTSKELVIPSIGEIQN